MAFPIEALPHDEEMDTAIPLSHKLHDHGGSGMDKTLEFDPSSYPIDRNSTFSSADFDDGVDGMDGGSISWPPTPSCEHVCLDGGQGVMVVVSRWQFSTQEWR